MNARQLRLLARLMFEWELLRAIDWRDHNPDYRSISKNLESRVDRLLGFECAPVFSPGDDLYRAVLKSSRKRIIAENLHSAIVDAMGSPSFEHITSKIRKALDEEVTRLNRRLGIKALLARSDGFLAFLLLCGYYGARRILRNRSLLLRQFRDWREGCVRQRTFWKEYAASIGKIRRDARPVLMMIRVDWPQVGYSVGKIVTELQQAGTPVCCVVAEGLDPTRSPVLPHGWDWLREVEVMSLP
ncbi:MAG: hypothetical protein HYV04_20150, partial [Deltaproteobacteria bacterium]|nr:hypothetical protein [Deltaproteobacteria bacterium]